MCREGRWAAFEARLAGKAVTAAYEAWERASSAAEVVDQRQAGGKL
jgi:hypothetical protein